MSATTPRVCLIALALLCCVESLSNAQELAAVSPSEKPPTVEKFEEPTPPAPGETNNANFRFTYPVRDTNSDQTYTEAPPAQSDQTEPSLEAQTEVSSPASLNDVVTSFQDSPATTGEMFAEMENLPTGPEPDIGEGRFAQRPFRFSFAVYEGYNSNVNGTSTDPVESLYTSIAAGVAYDFGSSRLRLSASLDAALAFYYNNERLQNDGIYPTITLGVGADYKATPKLDLSFVTSTSLLSQPDFAGGGGGPSNYAGDYISSASTLAATYRWMPKFETITSYSPLIYYYLDPEGDNFSYFDQTLGQQFLFLWKPTTALVAEYRFNLRNYWELSNYNSLGNIALLGFNHTFNPRCSMSLRGGAEQRISQNPVAGGNYNYIGPFGELTFTYAFTDRTSLALTSRYGTTGTGINNYSQDQQFLVGLRASHRFGRRLTLGAFATYQNNYYAQPGGEVDGVDLTPSFSYNIFNAGVNAGYYLLPERWSVNAGYAFTTLMSGDTAYQGDYTQNIVFLGTQVNF